MWEPSTFSSAKLLSHHIPLRACKWSCIHLADRGSQTILGQVTLRLSLRIALGLLWLTVVPVLTDAASYILGSATLLHHRSVVHYDTHTLWVCNSSTCCRIPFCPLPGFGLGEGERTNAWGGTVITNFAAAAISNQVTPVCIGRKAAKRDMHREAHALLVRPTLLSNNVVPSVTIFSPKLKPYWGSWQTSFRKPQSYRVSHR